MLQADTDSADARRDPLRSAVDLVETCTTLGESTGDFVDKASSRKPAARTASLSTCCLGGGRRCCVPATDDLALRLAHSDVISDNDELDAVGLVRVLCRILLLRKTEVQDVSRVVSGGTVRRDMHMGMGKGMHFTMITVLSKLSLPNASARGGHGLTLCHSP